MKKTIKVLVVLGIAALLVVVGIKKLKQRQAQNASTPVAKVYPIVVKEFIPKVSDVTLSLPYLAVATNDSNVKLSSRIASRILDIKQSGSKVTKGEVLVSLDTTDLNAQIDAQKIALKNLEQTHHRTQKLYDVNGASIEQLQKEQSQIASLKAKLKVLENQLGYATLTSPIDGTISKTFVASGDMAMPGKPLLQISADDNYSLLLRVPQDIKPKEVIFNHQTYPLHNLKTTFHGLDEYKAFLKDRVNVGERVEVDVVLLHQKSVLLPFDTILNRDGKSYVVMIQNNKAVAKEVHILQSAQQGVVVKENLVGTKLVYAKPDILLRLISGYPMMVQE